MMLVSIAINFEIQTMQNREESLDVASPGQPWFPSLDSASSDSCVVFRKSAYGSAKFVHRCLALTTPALPALLFQRIWHNRLNAAFCSLLRWRLILFEKPNQQNQEKCRGGYFRRNNRDQPVPGFQTGPISTSTGAEWSCARSVLAIITSVSSENKLAGSKRNPRKQTSTPEHEKKNHLTWLRSPPRWMQNHHETDPKQQCDRDANDATNPSMQNRTILIQCDRALTEKFSVAREGSGRFRTSSCFRQP